MKKVVIFAVLAFLLAFSATPAYANGGPPSLPHAFYGNVTINNAVAPNGTAVSATVDNGTIIPTQNPVNTVGGSYGVTSLKLLVQGDIPPGATITFHVTNANGTAVGGTATFEAGGGPTLRDLSVTIAAPEPEPEPEPEPPVGAGAPPPPPPPPGTTDVRGVVTTAGVFTDDTTAISDDELCTLSIPAETVGLTKELEPLTEITMTTMTAEEQAQLPTPTPDNIIVPEGVAIPADAYIVSLVYNFGPPGATFEAPIIDDQAVTLTLSYDETLIPAGVTEENLIIVYWDETAGKWEALQNIVIDSDNNTVSGELTHFTAFTILGLVEAPPPAPAAFSVSNLAIEPAEVQLGEEVTITVSVANTGGSEGTYTVVLKINGVKEAEASVTLRAGGTLSSTFSVTKEDVRSYDVAVDHLSGSFTVLAPAPPPPPTPVPPTPVVPPAEPINWPVLGVVIAGVVVAGLSIFFLIRRRAH